MPVGAAISAAGAVAGAGIGALGAKSAAKTEAAGARDAAALQSEMYNTTRNDLGSYRDFGGSALSPYAKLLGLDQTGAPIQPPKIGDVDPDAFLAANPDVAQYYAATPAAQQAGSLQDFAKDVAKQQAGIRKVPTYNAQSILDWRSPQEAALEQTPGYQFARDQGVQAVNRSLGSKGLTGAQAKGIARFVTGLADSTYGAQVDRLASAATLGQNSAAQTGTIGQGYANSIGGNIVGAATKKGQR